ncbi:hypothetical protein [Flavobacterium beibuense]|uniref:Uncharacterized protein n=1 Tax=Flavobacterium beibuense TaxID=657326 RepID=A0A444W7T7_9FLAO|nr:hypothetical protein [Flavobacterium beibuense]RYJ41718.1 hypothetical protein NU09_2643 [Flavobacterium beibuense]
MKPYTKYAFIWASILFTLHTFVAPAIGVSNNKTDLYTILFNLVLWTIAGIIVSFLKKNDLQKKKS